MRVPMCVCDFQMPLRLLARVADELSQRRWKLSGEPAESLRFCILTPVSIDELQLSHLAG